MPPIPPIFQNLPQTLGDYTLHRLHGSQTHSDFYEAKQEHVERHVIIEVIDTTTSPIPQEQLIETARARASRQILGAMPVYDARSINNYFYIAQELPPGESLEQLRMKRAKLPVLSLCRLLEKIGDLYISCEIEQINTSVLTGNMIYIVDENNVRFLSPAQSQQLKNQSNEDKMRIMALTLQPLLPLNVPGATRIQSLVSWLHDGFEGQRLSWGTIASTARLIIEQLHPELLDGSEELERYNLRKRRQKNKIYSKPLFQAFLSALIAGSLTLGYTLLCPPDAEKRTAYQTAHQSIIINNQAVSVQEYKAHLDKLAELSENDLSQIHKGIPESQQNHTPDDWDEQLLCLHDKKTCATAVHSVSYWDALVYSRLQHENLASSTALKSLSNDGIPLHTEEWSAEQQDYPIYGKSYFIINNSGQINREFNPNTRSPQRGFRTQQSIKKQASV